MGILKVTRTVVYEYVTHDDMSRETMEELLRLKAPFAWRQAGETQYEIEELDKSTPADDNIDVG